MLLSERWIRISEKTLDQIKRLEEAKERDRLELVSSILFLLNALRNSLLGWIQWANNPNIMARFTQKDLEKIAKKLSTFTRTFIEYDIEATKLGAENGLKPRKDVGKKRGEQFLV
jgi:hypothetical protein